MVQTCSICGHRDRYQIEKEIVSGMSLATVSRKHDLSYDSLWHHKEHHLPGRLVGAAGFRDLQNSQNILASMETLLQTTEGILEKAVEKDQNTLALKAIKEVRNNLEILAKLEFAITQQMQIQQNATTATSDQAQQFTSEFWRAFKRLPKKDQETYRAITIDVMSLMGGIADIEPIEEEEDPDSSQDIEYRLDANGHSLIPTRTKPRPADPDPDPAPGRTTPRQDPDQPMRRSTPRQ